MYYVVPVILPILSIQYANTRRDGNTVIGKTVLPQNIISRTRSHNSHDYRILPIFNPLKAVLSQQL
jgi:hypothetical protein